MRMCNCARHVVRPVTTMAATMALLLMGALPSAMAGSAATCSVPAIVAHALPAIVNITVVKVLTSDSEDEGAPGNANSGLAAPKPNAAGRNGGSTGPHFETFVGSGTIVNPSGIIITNKHVIKNAAVITVTLDGRKQVPAKLIAAASLLDLAVLKIDVPEPLPALQFGNSDKLQVGQSVIAVGNPLGLGTSVSVGVVSARGRDLMKSPFDDFIQTDATINPGNSGGPLLDCSGHVVGMDTALLSNSHVLGSIGIGFALPSNVTRFVTGRLLYPDAARANWIGADLQTLTARLATIFGRPDMVGAIVTRVAPGSPAAAAAIVPGDIISGADGRRLDDASAILRFVLTQPLGVPISLLVWHHDEMQNVVVRGQAWPNIRALRSNVLASPTAVAQAQAAGLGLHLSPSNAAGVSIDQVTPGSQADRVGIKKGDVIEYIDDHPATTPATVIRALARRSPASGHLIALLVHGQTESRWITLYIGRIDTAGLIASPSLPSGFGPTTEADAGVP